MSFIGLLKSKYTDKRMNKIQEMERDLYNQENTVSSNSSSPDMVQIEKKIPLTAIPTMLSVGKNIDYSFQSLKDNPERPGTSAPPEFIDEFESMAQSSGIVAVGYTRVPLELIFKDKAVLYEHAIVLTKEIDEDLVNNEFSGKTSADLKLYNEFGKITNKLADHLRDNGFGAQANHPAMGSVAYPMLAQKAGLGWKGRSNLLITPELGPRQKISAIFTSIENLPFGEENEHSWIADYCDLCGKCIRKCPEGAISEVNGYNRTRITPEVCRGCNESCTICMGECPFNRKGYTFIKNQVRK